MYVMSRLKETQVAAISSSFYENVSLLTQMVSPSHEFQRHFKKDIFDKPNTAGFLHISHYLSTIYDAKLFKQMVRWPILCKRDETTYRIGLKDFLCLLSRDNPDLNFPPILMTYLIQSGGTKFQIIIWKLSQLSLRTYIKRELKGELLNAPRINPVQDLTIMYFNNIITQKCSTVIKIHTEEKRILDAANNFLNDETERLNMYKSDIFNRKENIKKLVVDLPADALIKKQLMNVEDPNITDLWKRNIFKKIQVIYKKNTKLNELKESLDRLCKLVFRINSNPRTLDANEFPKICYDNYLFYTRSKRQHLIHNLYANDSIVFSALLSLLYLTIAQIYYKNIADLSDLSQCLPFIQNACRNMKSLRTLFNALIAKIDGICRDEQCAMSQETKNTHSDFDASSVSIANRSILLQSPRANFDFDQSTDDNLFYERLCSSPTEGKHKHLFRRYKREYHPLRELPAVLLDFSNSWNNMSGWLSPRANSTNCEQIFKGKPISPLYSRLFHCSKLNLKRSKDHVPRSQNAPSVNYEGLNLTPKKRPLKMRSLTMNDYNGKMRNLF